MEAILWSWAVSAAVLLVFAVVLGLRVSLPPGDVKPKPLWLGILVDNRGRFSLNRLQLIVWTIVVISLIAGVFFGRLIEGVAEPLEFTIPGNVLGLLGISVGSAVTVATIKSSKAAAATVPPVPPLPPEVVAPAPNRRAVTRLATYQATGRPPALGQMLMAEEGAYADDIVDAGKFQSFAITIVLVVAYVAMAISTISDATSAAGVTALPDLKGTFLVLLGISYAGYAGSKLPTPPGTPRIAVNH
jgi:hypothetical protein